MMLKTDLLGWLLNAQFALSLGAVCLPKKWCKWIWLAVAPLAIAILTVRWYDVGYPPMRNLFEAFLWLPLFLTTLTTLTFLRDRTDLSRLDAFIGVLIAFPLAFVFKSTLGRLPPVLQSPLFVPHVLGYMIAYTLLARAFAMTCLKHTLSARESAAWGFGFLTLALALGSYWGNEAWGAYWQWDPKEQWSLATWLLYAAYFHVQDRSKWRFSLLGAGVLFILLTVTWINLSKLFSGMHSYAGV